MAQTGETWGLNVSDGYRTATATPPRLIEPRRSWLDAMRDLDGRIGQLWHVVHCLEASHPSRSVTEGHEVPSPRPLDRVAQVDLVAEQLAAISARLMAVR